MVTFVKEFENYILSNFKEESLLSIIPGSQADVYLQLLNNIKKIGEKGEVTQELKQITQKAAQILPPDTTKEMLLLVLLKEYDLESTKQERKEEILREIQINFYPFLNFNFPKPSHVHIAKSEESSSTSKHGDTLDNTIFDIQKIVEEYIKKPESRTLTQINMELFFTYVDISKMPEEFFNQWIINRLFYPAPSEMSNEALKTFALFVNTFSEKNKYAPNLNDILSKMTICQIEKLSELISSQYFDKNLLLNQLLDKKYYSQLSYCSNDSEKREIFLQIYNMIKDKSARFNSLKSQTLFIILDLGCKLNQYDLKIFLEYIKSPSTANEGLYKLQQEKKIAIQQQVNYSICDHPVSNDENKIVKDYLRHFFLFENVKIEVFEEFLNYDFLRREYYAALVLKGEESDEIIKYLKDKRYEELVTKTEITICNHNKSSFDIEENVALQVDVKNIQTLFVKIFEINTENYYYNKKAPLNTAISLEGLIPSYEETFSFNEKPQKIVRRTFEFEKIPKRRGIYIIEFIGGGYSSRAIIKKGGFSLVTRSTAKGKMIFILNEKSEICKSEGTGVWFKDNFYTCDKDKGHIVIPYMRKTYNEPCILLHDNFAEFAKLEITEEKYELKGAFHINHESLIMGNTAKVLFRPYLYINGRETKVEYLKNCKITATQVKTENEASIPVSNTFDKLSVNNEKEIEFELQIPPKLTKIDLTFEAEVNNLSKEKTDKLSFSQTINMTSFLDDNLIVKMFLRKSNNEHILSVLGKNGEPKPNSLIELNFGMKNTTKEYKHTLETNDKGEVYLGKCENVFGIRAATYYLNKNINCFWVLPQNVVFSYPSNLDILESESITLPFDESCIDQSNMRFYKINEKKEVIEELLSLVKLIPVNDAKTRFNLRIQGLEQGLYVLKLKKVNVSVEISVHAGKIWTNNFIIKKDKIIENTEYKYPIYIKDVQINENGNLKIQIGSQSEKARVHVLTHQFLQNYSNYFSKNMSEMLSSGNYHSEHSFQSWSNFYMSNRLLSDEIQYVFDRKHLERFLGNSLEKPSLLLKRQFIRDTTTKQEQLESGTLYEKKQMDLLKEEKKWAKQNITAQKSLYVNYPNQYSDFHNFLANSPIVIFNCNVDQDGFIQLDHLPLQHFSHLQIIAFDEKSICEEIISLPANNIEKRNLTLLKSLNPQKTFSELRKSQLVHITEEVLISDIASTSFKILDSLDKLVNFKLLLTSGLQKEWTAFSFLLKFNELSEEEQKKKYTNFFSHEMNVFLYFKFPNLFEKYVKPVLKFKSEKTFIDFFLLNDTESLSKFYNSVRINSLNAFEKSLLIISLNKENGTLAKHIRNSLFTQADEVKISGEDQKRRFNIMMNMKSEDEVATVVTQRIEGGGGLFGASISDDGSRQFQMAFSSASARRAPELNMFNMAQNSMNVQQRNYNENMGIDRYMTSLVAKNEMIEEYRDYAQEEYEEDMFDQCAEEEENLQKINARNNLYQNGGVSKEYKETHYYNNSTIGQGSSAILSNFFWVDFADHVLNNKGNGLINSNFLSKHVLLPTNTITELIFILSVLDLPFTSSSHQFNRKEGRSLQIKADSNLLIFTKEITESNSDINSNLMIAQNVTELDQNLLDEKVIKEYLVNKIYAHETIITNISSNKMTFELLIQVPEGSIPVYNSEYTKTIHLSLDKFNTTNFKTYFYFPGKGGSYIQYPPNAAIDGTVIAKAEARTYEVVEEIRTQSKESLDDILVNGSKKDILEFIDNQKKFNVNDLQKVLWLLKEKDFYSQLIEILKRKGVYLPQIWAFAFYHLDIQIIREFLDSDLTITASLGPIFNSGLIRIDETNNFNINNHVDYNPILNARVHRLGREANVSIMNREFKETYEKFIIYLLRFSSDEIDAKCWIRLCYYLILQDRIEEALKLFSTINTGDFNVNSSLLIQYDYIAAYLDFSIGYPEFKIAKEVCSKYKNFPLLHWRELFEEIEDQLIEYEGKEVCSDIDSIIDEEKKKKQMMKNIIQSEPTLSFTIENKTLQILHSNIELITVKFYLIDLEILFSRAPFIKSNSDDFSYVQPNFVKQFTIASGNNRSVQELLTFAIPSEFISKNLFIEVSSIDKKTFETYFSTSLKVSISENLGEIKVTNETLQPLSKVYVKCFARMKDGSVKFYKDGYTDLRGKFNYISLNTDQLKNLQRFSVFIMHDEYGSIIKECSPPANIKTEGSDYDNFQNYRQEVRQQWRAVNKKNK